MGHSGMGPRNLCVLHPYRGDLEMFSRLSLEKDQCGSCKSLYISNQRQTCELFRLQNLHLAEGYQEPPTGGGLLGLLTPTYISEPCIFTVDGCLHGHQISCLQFIWLQKISFQKRDTVRNWPKVGLNSSLLNESTPHPWLKVLLWLWISHCHPAMGTNLAFLCRVSTKKKKKIVCSRCMTLWNSQGMFWNII